MATTQYGRWAQRQLQAAIGEEHDAMEPLVLYELQDRLDALLAPVERPVRILDAGCGKQLQVPIAADRHVTGIDISPAQVAKNSEVDESFVGDIQTYPLPPESFDAVVCWNVLEHLPDPARALGNLQQALKKGGVLVLAGPHPRSFKGVITDLTPFWFHKLVWRRLLKSKEIEPFPTYMVDLAQPENLAQAVDRLDMSVEFMRIYENWQQKAIRFRRGPMGWLYRGALKAVSALTFGGIRDDVTDFLMVCVKR